MSALQMKILQIVKPNPRKGIGKRLQLYSLENEAQPIW